MGFGALKRPVPTSRYFSLLFKNYDVDSVNVRNDNNGKGVLPEKTAGELVAEGRVAYSCASRASLARANI